MIYLLNEHTLAWLSIFDVPDWAQRVVATWSHSQWLTTEDIRSHLERDLAQRLNTQQQARVPPAAGGSLEAAALSAYKPPFERGYAQTDFPKVAQPLSGSAKIILQSSPQGG